MSGDPGHLVHKHHVAVLVSHKQLPNLVSGEGEVRLGSMGAGGMGVEGGMGGVRLPTSIGYSVRFNWPQVTGEI